MIHVIPKVVHYCWFGGKPKPAEVERYLANWRSVLPDYEIREWNEQNFGISAWPYAVQAMEAGKFAFVSDVARLHALYAVGGIYLDTDVELRRTFDDLLANDVVLGFEEGNYVATSTMLARPGSRLMGAFLQTYVGRDFRRNDGWLDETTNVQVLTSLLEEHGLNRDGSAQDLQWGDEQIRVLVRTALSPIDYPNGIDHSNAQTYAVHHFGQSWAGPALRIKTKLRKMVIGLIGGGRLKRMRYFLSKFKSKETDVSGGQ